MGYDALKVVSKESSEPLKMTVSGCTAGIHDPGDVIRHTGFISAGVGKRQTLLNQIKREQKLVLTEKFVISCFITLFPDVLFLGKDGTGPLIGSPVLACASFA